MPQNYIVVEGVIGVGKTSLVDRLCQEINGKPVLEKLDENPFVTNFYKDMRGFAFQTQIYFLLTRYRQQESLNQGDLFVQSIISDYLFAKDRIFAYLNLDENELSLYEKIYSLLHPRVPRPDLVIYLQASTDRLIERIKERGRAFEKNISREYIDELNKAYNNFFFYYKESPLLVINTNDIDFIHKKDDLKDLVREIKEIKAGTKYYVPASRK